jgi:hypothetical protein
VLTDGEFPASSGDDEEEKDSKLWTSPGGWTYAQRDAFKTHTFERGLGRWEALRCSPACVKLGVASKTDKELRAYECGLLVCLCSAANSDTAGEARDACRRCSCIVQMQVQ